MALTELACEVRNNLPASLLINGPNLASGQIVGAILGDGIIASSTHEVLLPEENARFMLLAIGRNAVGGVPIADIRLTDDETLKPRQEKVILASAAEKLGTAGCAAAISHSFATGKLKVETPITLPRALTTRQLEVLQLFSKDMAVKDIAEQLLISRARVDGIRNGIFAKLRTGSIYGATTRAHLAGILPRPTTKAVLRGQSF